MPMRMDDSRPREQDRVPERGRSLRDEVSNFEPDADPDRGNPDTTVTPVEDPEINTHGSQR